MNENVRKARHLIVENLLVSIVVIVLVSGGAGYAIGAQSSTGSQRQFGPGMMNSQGAGSKRANAMNAVFGIVSAKDQDSITVSLGGPGATSTNGNARGSRIVLVNGATQVGKFVQGSIDDLSIGQSVTANGTANSDGSITATQIQIRPAGESPRSGAPMMR